MFDLTDKQKKEAFEFVENHDCSLGLDAFGNKNVGAIGGETTYCFSPTGLGTVEVVKCSCGAELNLTNFDNW